MACLGVFGARGGSQDRVGQRGHLEVSSPAGRALVLLRVGCLQGWVLLIPEGGVIR